MDIDEIAQAYFEGSRDDYIGLWEIAHSARKRLGAHSTGEARTQSLEIVRRLYEKGLRPGDYWGGSFDYWPEEGCQAVLDRIEREWIAFGDDPNLAHPICWFAPQPQ